MQRRVENTRNVIYCHSVARMVSYAGITRKIRVRLKWPVDIYVQDLQFMTTGWRKKIRVTPFRLQ
jgi:biotin-(acetyl-CoA carboxylase) ligase